MTDDPQKQQAAHDMALAQHKNDIDEIAKLGASTIGTEAFDEAATAFAHSISSNSGDVGLAMVGLKEFDRPDLIIAHLAENPDRLDKFSKMPLARQMVEAAKIASQMTSYGHVEGGSTPAWRKPEIRQRTVSDADWSKNFGAGLDDKAFDKVFWEKQKARAERRR